MAKNLRAFLELTHCDRKDPHIHIYMRMIDDTGELVNSIKGPVLKYSEENFEELLETAVEVGLDFLEDLHEGTGGLVKTGMVVSGDSRTGLKRLSDTLDKLGYDSTATDFIDEAEARNFMGSNEVVMIDINKPLH